MYFGCEPTIPIKITWACRTRILGAVVASSDLADDTTFGEGFSRDHCRSINSPDNSYYVLSVFAGAVEAHLERAFGIELNPTLSLFLIFYFWGTLIFRVSAGSRLDEKIIGLPEIRPTTP